jgi:hypothetical protein
MAVGGFTFIRDVTQATKKLMMMQAAQQVVLFFGL